MIESWGWSHLRIIHRSSSFCNNHSTTCHIPEAKEKQMSIICLPLQQLTGIIENHTKDPQSRVHKIDQASHMQFHRGSVHRSHSCEEISPAQNRNCLILGCQHNWRSPSESSGFTLKSKLFSLFVVASTVNLSRCVPACSSSETTNDQVFRMKRQQLSRCNSSLNYDI